jgi:hypothetical protein
MAGKKPKPAPAPAGHGTAARVLARSLLAVGLVGAVVGLIRWVGDQAGEAVADRPRYQVSVADLRCPVPPGVDPAAFLTEVRFLGQLPATVSAVAADTPQALTTAFARHPWVERVDGVAVGPDRTISVGLTFRTPTLTVRVRAELDERVVDRGGVLLPPGTATAGLPVLTPSEQPPGIRPGERWPGEVVPRAAELADQHRGRRLVRVERLPGGGWRLLPAEGNPLRVSF